MNPRVGPPSGGSPQGRPRRPIRPNRGTPADLQPAEGKGVPREDPAPAHLTPTPCWDGSEGRISCTRSGAERSGRGAKCARMTARTKTWTPCIRSRVMTSSCGCGRGGTPRRHRRAPPALRADASDRREDASRPRGRSAAAPWSAGPSPDDGPGDLPRRGSLGARWWSGPGRMWVNPRRPLPLRAPLENTRAHQDRAHNDERGPDVPPRGVDVDGGRPA